MTSPEFTHPEPSTPEQASLLLAEVGTLTTFQGSNYGDRNTFGMPIAELPPTVAEHVPHQGSSSKVANSVYVVQIFDRDTGRPKRDGVVGSITFTQQQEPTPGVIYTADVNYHITSSDSGETYGLERHVTNTEISTQNAKEREEAVANPIAFLAGLTALRIRVEDARSTEAAMGLLTVTGTEALQLIEFAKSLNTSS